MNEGIREATLQGGEKEKERGKKRKRKDIKK